MLRDVPRSALTMDWFLANYTVRLHQLLTHCQLVLNWENVCTIQSHSNNQIDVKTSYCTLLYVRYKQIRQRWIFILSPPLNFYERKAWPVKIDLAGSKQDDILVSVWLLNPNHATAWLTINNTFHQHPPENTLSLSTGPTSRLKSSWT